MNASKFKNDRWNRPALLLSLSLFALVTFPTKAAVVWQLVREDSSGEFVSNILPYTTRYRHSTGSITSTGKAEIRFTFDANTNALSNFNIRLGEIFVQSPEDPFFISRDAFYFQDGDDGTRLRLDFAEPLTNQGGRVNLLPVDPANFENFARNNLLSTSLTGSASISEAGIFPDLYVLTAENLNNGPFFLYGTPVIPEPGSSIFLVSCIGLLLNIRQRHISP